MSKLEKLTPEQEQIMLETKQEYLDKIFKCETKFDKDACIKGIHWMYELAKLKKPIVIICDSPLAAQYGAFYAKAYMKALYKFIGAKMAVPAQVGDQVRDQVWDQVWDQVRDQVRDQVGDQVWDQVWDQVRDQVRDQVWDQVGDQVEKSKIPYESFGSYGNIWDYGWVSFYSFFQKTGILKHPLFPSFKAFVDSGIYDAIQLDGICVVCQLPKAINRKATRLHNESGASIEWNDGYKLFFWNGVCVPEKWIMDKDGVTKHEILSESNAEKRRVLREILGAKKYYDVISDGKGLTLLDEDIDSKGFPMRLYETSINDEIINKKVQFLECVCPSTERVYNIYPVNQQCKNVFQAKASTFGMDEKSFQPVIET